MKKERTGHYAKAYKDEVANTCIFAFNGHYNDHNVYQGVLAHNHLLVMTHKSKMGLMDSQIVMCITVAICTNPQKHC